MLASLLIGLAAGQRAMTPPAILALADRRGALAPDAPGAGRLGRSGPLAAFLALALAEIGGDKLPSAPDRTVLPGLLARCLTAAFAGAVLAPRAHRASGAGLAAAVAFGTSFAGLALRRRGLEAFGRVPSGLAEDAAVILTALLAVDASSRADRRRASSRVPFGWFG